ncbi:MAG: hypothetical protein OWQ54_01760 [Sulfolobaceae archaeon]|nr:hypothetical protein [Sulfolobaceae archaeon]
MSITNSLLSFYSTSLNKDVKIRAYNIGNRVKNIVLLLEPYGYHSENPFGTRILHYLSQLDNTLIIEPDASLGIPVKIKTEVNDFKNLKRGCWYVNSPYAGNYLTAFSEIVKYFLEKYEIKNRIYVTGASMGGWGSILFSSYYPDLFQGAISVDGPAFFGKSFLIVERNLDVLTKMTGVDSETTLQYFKDMIETLDFIFTNNQLLKTIKVEGNEVTVDKSLFSRWELWFPINVIEKARKDVEYHIIVNYFDTTTLLSDEKLHEKMMKLDIPHEYIVFLGKKEASHFTGIVDGFKYVAYILKEKLASNK